MSERADELATKHALARARGQNTSNKANKANKVETMKNSTMTQVIRSGFLCESDAPDFEGFKYRNAGMPVPMDNSDVRGQRLTSHYVMKNGNA